MEEASQGDAAGMLKFAVFRDDARPRYGPLLLDTGLLGDAAGGTMPWGLVAAGALNSQHR